MTQIFLDHKAVNNLVAALMIASTVYNNDNLKAQFPNESKEYKELEERVRDLCYKDGQTMCAIIGSNIN